MNNSKANQIVQVAAIVVILGGAFLSIIIYLHKTSGPAQPRYYSAAEYDKKISQPDKTFDLVIDENKLVSGPSKITVRRGDSVRVNIKAGGHEEIKVELDGYGISTEAAPEDGAAGGFSFVADKVGSFAFSSVADNESDSSAPEKVFPLGTIVVER